MTDPEHKDQKLSSSANVFVPRWKKLQETRSGSDDDDRPQFSGYLGSRSLSFGARMPSQMPQQQQQQQQQQQTFSARAWQPNAPFTPNNPSPQRSTFSRSASWREEALRRETGLEHTKPTGEEKPSKAITVEHKLIKPGTYSTWIRVLSADIGPAQLATVLGRCEESNNHGAIHVYLREKFINRQLVQQLKSQGYKFHHYVEETQTFVYGKRPQDAEDGRELMNATCKELIGALVVSPDEKQVLLTWEAGKWIYLSGYTITRENVVDSLKREVRSQFGLELDRTYAPRMVGGWNRAAEKFDCINEIFMCFVVRTTSSPSAPTDDAARWFNIDDLIQLLDMVDAQSNPHEEPKLDASIEHPPGNVFSHLALRWIKTFHTNKAWTTAAVSTRQVFYTV
eukprot:c10159_g1_i1.p1 GENE.c10159_g1_i1~~c10159_g1_i1.p1  ORF type:complete len:396 (-),score=83.34 c10159_g1_i1:38-1225(-)